MKILNIAVLSAVLGLSSTTILASHTGVFPEFDYLHFTLKNFPANATLKLSGFPAAYNLAQYTVNSNGQGNFNAQFEVSPVRSGGGATLVVTSDKLGIGCGIAFEDTDAGIIYQYPPLCQHLEIGAIVANPDTGMSDVVVTYKR